MFKATINKIAQVLGDQTFTVKVANIPDRLQTGEQWRFPQMINRVLDKEMEACVELIRNNLVASYLAPNSWAIRDFCLNRIPAEGLLLEFGVGRGKSINQMAERLATLADKRILHGFDAFEGLPTDGGGWVWHKGRFDRRGKMPEIRDNIRLHKGWIEQTLPRFLAEHSDETIAFIHVDVDLYEPAKAILEICKRQLRPGSLILFDELIGYAGWRFNEYRALNEVYASHEYEFIAFSDITQAAIRIK